MLKLWVQCKRSCCFISLVAGQRGQRRARACGAADPRPCLAGHYEPLYPCPARAVRRGVLTYPVFFVVLDPRLSAQAGFFYCHAVGQQRPGRPPSPEHLQPTIVWDRILNDTSVFGADLLVLDPLAAIYLDDENDRGRRIIGARSCRSR